LSIFRFFSILLFISFPQKTSLFDDISTRMDLSRICGLVQICERERKKERECVCICECMCVCKCV